MAQLSLTSSQIFFHADILPHHSKGSETNMDSRFKSNNLVAILIAVLLFATGFALYFIHRQTESRQEREKAPTAFISQSMLTTQYPPSRDVTEQAS
jgi:heme/copper-type cytochrome/quinol oxidase subunit 3